MGDALACTLRCASSQSNGAFKLVNAPPALEKMSHGAGDQTPGPGSAQQALARLVQRREMRHGREPQAGTEIGMIGQVGADATIVGLEESLQDQAGKELRLRVAMGTKAVGVHPQGAFADGQRMTGHTQRRFTQRAHITLDAVETRVDSTFSTEPARPLFPSRGH